MALQNLKNLKKLDDEALVHAELQLERDLITASFRLRTGQLDDTSSIGRVRRDLARSRTLQRQRELDHGLAKDSLRSRYRPTFQPSVPETEGTDGSGGFLKGLVDKISGSN
ncbi:MAG: 50S ribosomal protein L29 [Oligoflexia bacterium]|nr:50S ribosomal protein L29 [Oligoflexia bacterium]